ncbi:MAG: AraC family transcriptional regulator [Bacteroidales bacterium]|nr:AraC family transcriptional regulator [Bacteroidales bacterium]MCM1415160.1 AraC family transcriptional regulator [bacterium]MCM1423380.1 AraC family transcriptional regulator [bacterium]
MYKALIIDDEKPVQIAIQKLGHWNAYRIEQPRLAVNGKDGLQAMREFHPDIVFVDMNMPVMDGASFLQAASQEFPNSQYIVVSGYDQFSYAQQALRYGACEYLLKPVEEEALNSAIEKAILRLDPEAVFAPEETAQANISPEEVVAIIKEYIESHYNQNIRITMFSEQYFFSTEYLTRLFRNRYGCTIYEYVQKLRMERAKELLEDENNKILDIAERLGYTDNHYFSKAFRNYYDISPSQYRKNLQKKDC